MVLSYSVTPIAENVASTLDLNGFTIEGTADKTGNQEMFLVKGNMTVKDGNMKMDI